MNCFTTSSTEQAPYKRGHNSRGSELLHCPAHFLPRAVVPYQLRVLVAPLKHVDGRLWRIPHRIHEDDRKELNKEDAHLEDETVADLHR